ncbi:MAG: hypothetical protein ACM3SO_20140, partial [Betaproteobacteria bacterium]
MAFGGQRLHQTPGLGLREITSLGQHAAVQGRTGGSAAAWLGGNVMHGSRSWSVRRRNASAMDRTVPPFSEIWDTFPKYLFLREAGMGATALLFMGQPTRKSPQKQRVSLSSRAQRPARKAKKSPSGIEGPYLGTGVISGRT